MAYTNSINIYGSNMVYDPRAIRDLFVTKGAIPATTVNTWLANTGVTGDTKCLTESNAKYIENQAKAGNYKAYMIYTGSTPSTTRLSVTGQAIVDIGSNVKIIANDTCINGVTASIFQHWGATVNRSAAPTFNHSGTTVVFFSGTTCPAVCSGYTSVTQAYFNGITSFNYAAFSGCTNMSCTLGGTVSYVGDQAFRKTKITSINISGNGTIGNYAFANCTSLTSVTISGSITKISQYAFYGCTSLKTVNLSGCASLTTIEGHAFHDCTSLSSLTINGNAKISTIDIAAFQNCSLLNPPSLLFANATNIYASAFANTGIITLTLQSSIARIDDNAFGGCKKMTSISWTGGSQRTVLGVKAFSDCTALTTATLGNIDYQTQMSSTFSGCTSLKVITVTAPTANQCNNTTFYGVTRGGTLKVPSSSLSGYNSYWMKTNAYFLGYYGWQITAIS